MAKDKYTLSIGYHRGTVMSRYATSETYDSYEEAHKAYEKHKSSYHAFGYVVWFADIIAPDGSKTRLESNPYS